MPDRIAPVRHRGELPAKSFRRADIPAGSLLFVGRLVAYRSGPSSYCRPLVGLRVWCPRCGREHQHTWRWDYGLDPDAVLPVAARCWRGSRRPYWIGLAPSAAEENAQVHARAQEEFLAWQKAELERRGAEKAERAARRDAAAAPSKKPMVPLWGTPVGPRGG